MRRVIWVDRWLILMVLLAFALRLHRIAVQSWWWDEGYSTYLARHGILAAIRMTAVDIHPPLYYILLSIWGTFTGYTEFTTRFLSTIFGILTLPLLYRVGREGAGRGGPSGSWPPGWPCSPQPMCITPRRPECIRCSPWSISAPSFS